MWFCRRILSITCTKHVSSKNASKKMVTKGLVIIIRKKQFKLFWTPNEEKGLGGYGP